MKLTKWMKKAKVKSADLARFLDIERSYIYKIMKGRQKPSKLILYKIRYLTMEQVKTFDDLIGYTEEKDAKEETENICIETAKECEKLPCTSLST